MPHMQKSPPPQQHTHTHIVGRAPVDRRAEEHEVRPQHRPDERQRDRRRLVDDQELRVREARVVLRRDVLHRLAVVAEDVGAHDGAAEGGVGRLDEVVVDVLLFVIISNGVVDVLAMVAMLASA